MQIEKISIYKIKTYDNNAKLHPDWQIEQIKRSIQEFGFNDPIAIDENDVIIEGHGRYEALKQLGYEEVEIIRLNHLSEEQKVAYTLAHNKLTINTEFDNDMLINELNKLQVEEFDLSLTGFTPFEIENIFLEPTVFLDDDVEENLLEKYEQPPHDFLTCPSCNHKDTKAHFKVSKE